MSLSRQDPPDLRAARDEIGHGRRTAAGLFESCQRAAQGPECARAFVRMFADGARAVAQGVDRQRAYGLPLPALAGLAVSIKDLFDVAGQPTTADCPAVARLRAAGAALIGHTNLTEFAYSGVGINPHHGTPVNAGTRALDPTPRVPGGSTSGGATSVAAGAAWAALGSDTGGSIRIPAALQGLVGFKNTQRLTPLEGCIPLSGTLDTSCAITRSVRDAVLLHEVLASRRVFAAPPAPRLLRLAVPSAVMLDGLDPAVAAAFESALRALRTAGATVEEVDVPALRRLGTLNAQGGFAAAESWAWHRSRIAERARAYDPRVLSRIRRGEAIGAADYIDLLHARAAWIAEVESVIRPYHAMLSPTVPVVAPELAPLEADDAAFLAANARLLRNPSVVNFLDGCALSLPCQPRGQLPVGLMVWAGALADDRVLAVSLTLESVLARTREAYA